MEACEENKTDRSFQIAETCPNCKAEMKFMDVCDKCGWPDLHDGVYA